MLSLPEKIFLLAVVEKKDTIRLPSSSSLPYALAGAAVLDLILCGNARIDNGRLLINDLTSQREIMPTGADLLMVLEKIQKSDKVKKVGYWIYFFGSHGNRISRAILAGLVEKKILIQDGSSYQWTAAEEGDFVAERVSKYLLKRRLRDAVSSHGAIDEQSAVVFELMECCGMLDHIFTRDEIIAARKKVKRLLKTESQPFQELLAQIRSEVNQAAAAAVSM